MESAEKGAHLKGSFLAAMARVPVHFTGKVEREGFYTENQHSYLQDI